ncbi:hypothetical protein BDZ85DRAFT_44953 [Elsinoe ampelina]|uniref:Uncharacterized protein n=1 Tax=Elsinoe ampelina TaxID=302913 RepID=A0A6A6G103_9PEZI|nr:hypothetical protein BDZ85DRAFT_44953 [Elsinoe ampelina]
MRTLASLHMVWRGHLLFTAQHALMTFATKIMKYGRALSRLLFAFSGVLHHTTTTYISMALLINDLSWVQASWRAFLFRQILPLDSAFPSAFDNTPN